MTDSTNFKPASNTQTTGKAQTTSKTQITGKTQVSNDILSPEQCRSARLARDSRFDGLFFIAVKTTGIFCRSICPATPPKEENVEYFFHSSQALQSGYRPCLRCRPDSAPGSWAWLGTATTLQRAIRLIEQGALQQQNLEEFALRLGISGRYLRKLFTEQLGVSPKQYAQYHQLMFAKQLLHLSDMSISDIALASGFNSIRRFNDAFQKVLKLTPSAIRKRTIQELETSQLPQPSRKEQQAQISHQLTLRVRPPFNWQHTLDFYRLRAIKGIEFVDSTSYQRSFQLEQIEGWFKVSQQNEQSLQVEFTLSDIRALNALMQKIRRMLDLESDLSSIEQHLSQNGLAGIATPGIRIPGVWDIWEAGIRAILGQQVSIKAAITHLNQLTQQLNNHNSNAQSTAHDNPLFIFPKPEWIVASDLAFLKLPNSRKETLKAFARYMLDHPDEHPSQWQQIKGIGPWTIQYACIRGLSEPDHFLAGDLVIKKALSVIDKESESVDIKKLSPWGSYATFQCWHYYNTLADSDAQTLSPQAINTFQNNITSLDSQAMTTSTQTNTAKQSTRKATRKIAMKTTEKAAQQSYYSHWQSPLGLLTLQANDQGLMGLWLPTFTTKPDDLGMAKDDHPILQQAIQQCQEYFAGQRQNFDLPLAATGTEFQQQVWHALTQIPFGVTWSYQDLANAIGNPKAVRAVGLANGKNPISIIVPCHRVIGKNGKLTGYAGGVEQKEQLLKLEGAL